MTCGLLCQTFPTEHVFKAHLRDRQCVSVLHYLSRPNNILLYGLYATFGLSFRQLRDV